MIVLKEMWTETIAEHSEQNKHVRACNISSRGTSNPTMRVGGDGQIISSMSGGKSSESEEAPFETYCNEPMLEWV